MHETMMQDDDENWESNKAVDHSTIIVLKPIWQIDNHSSLGCKFDMEMIFHTVSNTSL